MALAVLPWVQWAETLGRSKCPEVVINLRLEMLEVLTLTLQTQVLSLMQGLNLILSLALAEWEVDSVVWILR